MSTGGGGSSKPEKVKVSAGEKIQAGLAKDQIDYYRATYAPLEADFLRTAGQDPSAKLAGQNAVGATRALTPALAEAALSTAPVDTAALGGAVTSGRVSGMAEGRRQRDDGRLEGLGVGLGVTADASKSLSQAASIQTSSAIDHANEVIAKQNAKNSEKEALVGGLASAGGMYLGYKMPQWQQQRLTQQKANATADAEVMKIKNGTNYRGAQGF